jgi:hypothetical protein
VRILETTSLARKSPQNYLNDAETGLLETTKSDSRVISLTPRFSEAHRVSSHVQAASAASLARVQTAKSDYESFFPECHPRSSRMLMKKKE